MRKKKIENLVKDYDFKTIDEYFIYIVDSFHNGQRTQTRNLYNKMKTDDQCNFREFVKEYYRSDKLFVELFECINY